MTCQSSLNENNPKPLHFLNEDFDIGLYHTKLYEVHSNIYRYNGFPELIDHLNSSLLHNYPYINYPSKEILLMILSASQMNNVDYGRGILKFSYNCLRYFNLLLNLFDKTSLLEGPQGGYFEKELKALYFLLSETFSFLRPQERQRRTISQKKGIGSNTPITLPDTESNMTEPNKWINDGLEDSKNEKLQSLFQLSTDSVRFDNVQLYGDKYLHEKENNLWNYFIFALRISSELTVIETMERYNIYYKTWDHWREFLEIILKFMTVELNFNKNIQDTLLITNVLNLSGGINIFFMENSQINDSLISFLNIVFIDRNSAMKVPNILLTDLALNENYNFPCNPVMAESKYKGSNTGLDSIPVRSKTISVCFDYLNRIECKELNLDIYESKVVTEILKFNTKEFLLFFETASSSGKIENNLHFRVSFSCISYIDRSFKIEYDSYDDDFMMYLQSIQIVLNNVSQKNSDHQNGSDNILEMVNPNLEKVFILANFQLSLILKEKSLTNEEKSKLVNISFVLRKKRVFFNKIIAN